MKKGILILMFLFTLIITNSSFKGINKMTKVTFQIAQDTLTFSPEEYNYKGVSFTFEIKNISKQKITLPKDGFVPGFKDEKECDYYLEFFKLVDDKKVDGKHSLSHVSTGEYLGEFSKLKPGKVAKYEGTTGILYPIKEPGKYYYRIVFINNYSWIGQSNLDSVVIIGKR